MSIKSKLSYSIVEAKLKGTKEQYKTQPWYKKMTLKQRRKYNKTVAKPVTTPGHKGKNFLSSYRKTLRKGTRLNVVPNVNLNSPLYNPRKSK
jgi:hypothetical protein